VFYFAFVLSFLFAEMKQTKLNFKPKKSANKEFDSSNSDDGMDSDSFDAVLEGGGSSPEKERAAPKRAAGTFIWILVITYFI